MRIRPVPLSFRVVTSAFLLAGLTTLVTAQTSVTVSGTVTGGGDHPIAGATVEFLDITHVPAASAVTDGDGRYSVQVITGVYDIRVTPPAGSGLLGANLTGRSIGESTTINIALIEPGAAILTGRVLDAAGAGIAGAYLSLQPSTALPPIPTETDTGGNYRFDAVRGTYVLTVNTFLPSLEPHRPQSASLNIPSLTLEGDRVLDLPLPVHRVDVHVQDADGHGVPGVGLSAAGVQNCAIVVEGLTACVSTSYSYFPGPAPMPSDYPQPLTDATGNFTMWMVDTPPMPPPPMPPMGGYTITATPPSGLGLPATAVQNVVVSGDTTLTITLRPALELRGRLLDGAGMAITGASVSLQPSAPGLPSLVTQTDFTGTYRFSAPGGTYSLSVTAWMPWLEPNRPQSVSINIWSLPLNADRVLDLTVPLHRVDVHVQDGDGNPVPGAGLSTTAMQNCSILFDGLAGCVSSSYAFNPGPPMPGMPEYPQPITNASGDFTMWLVATLPPPPPPMPPMGGYTITATPPALLGLPATAVPNIVVTGDTAVTITLQRALELRGRFLDAAGMPIVDAIVSVMASMPGLPPLTTQTDLTGTYRFSVPPGTYSLYAYAWLPWLAPSRPQSMSINISSLTLAADRVLDLAPPLHRVDIHVQDAAARPVAGVGLSASAVQNCQVLFDGVPGCVWASYSYYPGLPMPGMPEYPQPVTNASGDFTMWLAATPPDLPPPMPPMGFGYTLMATPPAGGPFTPFALSNVSVAGATQLLISLQFVHPAPVSSATLSPAADANGEYPDPVQLTLASSPAPGQSIARIEYRVDAGTVLTYAGPFTVSGGGSHELRFWAIDSAGVYEAPQALVFAIESIPTLPEIRETLAGLLASGNIDNEGVCNSLATKLRDEGQLQAFLNELDAQRGKHISETAYARLAADVRKFMQQ